MTQLSMLHKQYGNIVKLDGLMNRRSQVFLFCPQLCEEMYQWTRTSPIRINLESLYYYRKNRENIYDGQYGLAVRSVQQILDKNIIIFDEKETSSQGKIKTFFIIYIANKK